MTIRPDPTFYASPKLAMQAPRENFAYTLLLSPDFSQPDALAVIDVTPGSPKFSQVVHLVPMPNKGDEFHHFGWNACSSALSPLSGHAFLERRFLIIPGIRSSRIYSWIRSRTRLRQRSTRSSSPRKSCRKRAIHARTPCIAGQRAFTSARSAEPARTAPRALPAFSSWTAKRSKCAAAGKSTAAARTCITISGGTCRATTWSRASGRIHRSSRTAWLPKTCCRTSMATACISGTCGRAATSRRSTSAHSIRWRSKCALLTTPCVNTGSSASLSIPRTSKPRSGPGGVKTAGSMSKRPRRFRPNLPRPSNCRRY